MDEIAIISDIHGNMTALEAVLGDIQSRGIGQIYCLGDLIGKGPHGEEAIKRIRETCEVVVMGNWDDAIVQEHDNPYMKWHQQQLSDTSMNYLRSLPFHHDFYMSGYYMRLYHASAKSVHHRVVPWVHSKEEREAMFEDSPYIEPLVPGQMPDLIFYGDIHAACTLPVLEKRSIINVGSVGNSLDLPKATYTIIRGKLGTETAPFSTELVRLPYDVEHEIQLAKAAHMPGLEEYALELREGIYRNAKK
ncbi:serine/threonine protein phosphatase [Pontibacillus halophilus JSM 076056 = DSM 19796]|uniref:Serine/threonine protein phosphatase n=1 Tax=Pontibacillus halophilus JSM 076056 = DSM 19796 TaxID=1385510 RepID=A0A0A5I412_9BACI|nr:metallophosphoesterase family protein [Pontibacillus halophilus]KGX90552.1 serine/threonine protein phosphatase [Pontibacillus halophilus JSM 076056 = DSM 19796]